MKAASVARAFLTVVGAGVSCLLPIAEAAPERFYFNDFEAAVGTTFPEWTSSTIAYDGSAAGGRAGSLPTPEVAVTQSPNGRGRFLGEFGGPAIGKPGDAGWNRTRVEQTIHLTLHGLPAHAAVRLSFDLLILKSWDGNSPVYGPDRWSVAIAGGPDLLRTTFSNNPKVAAEGSDQDYPRPHSPPREGAAAVGSLGYSGYFKESVYRLEYTFRHAGEDLRVDFTSSLFEGKGTDDESWGLDNVSVEIVRPK